MLGKGDRPGDSSFTWLAGRAYLSAFSLESGWLYIGDKSVSVSGFSSREARCRRKKRR